MATLQLEPSDKPMIPKLVAAVVSAAILAAVLGTLPSEAIGAEQAKRKAPKHPAVARSVGSAGDLNSPSTDFSTVSPQIEVPDRDHVLPKRDKNQFFNQRN